MPLGTPAGALPPPPPPPFAALPAPTRCALPALGWQARQARPRPTPHLPDADPPAPTTAAVDPPRVDVATTAASAIELEQVEIRHADAPAHDARWHAAPAPSEAVEGRQLVGVARQVGRGAALAIVGVTGWLLLVTTLPRIAGWQPTVITGHSMEPSIERGDVVLVRPTPSRAYAPGVVITFDDASRPGRLVTHRVVAVSTDGTLVTKGDNNRDRDPLPVAPQRVRGRAVIRLPFAGRAVVWFLDRRWLPLALSVSLLAAAIRTVLRPRRQRRAPDARGAATS